jgi:hypothetical protein
MLFCPAAVLALMLGCRHEVPSGALVLTQMPVAATSAGGPTALDARYPAGSRVVVVAPPFQPGAVRVLSRGLFAAGDPCVSWDGRWVYFAGKPSAEATWQIYRADAGGGDPEPVTTMPGGAMDPALAAHEELVFTSPVPPAGQVWAATAPVAIYGQLPGQAPRRFTYGPDSAVGATVLRDGRILFVSAKPHDDLSGPRHLCLFAMNNDGTEVTAYAGQDDGVDVVRRPRELVDGRIAFLAARGETPAALEWAEGVRSAAPFATRASLFPFPTGRCRSIESTPEGDLLVCADTKPGEVGREMTGRTAVYRVTPAAAALGTPLFDDPQWNCVEATPVVARPEPAGHTTAVMPAATTGTILCLDANESSTPAAQANPSRAARLRVFAATENGAPRELGTVPVAADGSVLIRLPARVALGFDTLDEQGRILRHQPPALWLQPGENRGCVGCHEPRNHAPRNARPLATQVAPAQLDLPAAK